MTVYNWIYALFPFALFCFIAVVLTKRRFSAVVNGIVWGISIAAVAVPHIVLFAVDLDCAFLLTLMPITAYIPVSVVFFVLSGRKTVGNLFAILIGALCSVSVTLIHSVFSSFLRGNQNPAVYHVVNGIDLAICAAAAVALGFIVFRFLRGVFAAGEGLSGRMWFILPAMFLLLLISLWQKDSTTDIVMIVIVLLLDVSVIGVIAALVFSRFRQNEIVKEKALVEKQLEAEREEYAAMRLKVELGRRYRHDMRHHLSLIQKMLKDGNDSRIGEYVEGLDERLNETEKINYCKNDVINALISIYAEKSGGNGISFDAKVDLPERLFADEIDLCSLIANALDNAVNACAYVADGEKYIRLFAETNGERIVVSVKNSTDGKAACGADGLPIYVRTEEHGYGFSSMRHVAEKYSGTIKAVPKENSFTVVAVLFDRSFAGPKSSRRKSRKILRTAAAVPAVLAAMVFMLNSMPSALDALEESSIGEAVKIVDLRTYGWRWGDSSLDIEYPETGNEDADSLIAEYVEECKEKFNWYFHRKYNGYVAAEFISQELVNDDEIYVVRMSYILYAGSSAEYFRYFVIDKSNGEIVDLWNLFSEESDWESVLVNEILRQMEEIVEKGEGYFYGFGIWSDEARLSSLTDVNFYLDEDHQLVIVFDESEVAPGNMGSPSFTIPYSAVKEIVAEDSLLKEGAQT